MDWLPACTTDVLGMLELEQGSAEDQQPLTDEAAPRSAHDEGRHTGPQSHTMLHVGGDAPVAKPPALAVTTHSSNTGMGGVAMARLMSKVRNTVCLDASTQMVA